MRIDQHEEGKIKVKVVQRATAALLAVLLLLPVSFAAAAQDGFSTSYTYNFDYWGDVQESPDAYRVQTVIDSMTLGIDNLEGKRINRPQSLYVRDNDIFVCDTGNNRIIQIHRDKTKYTVVRCISEIKGADPSALNAPTDLFVDPEGTLYIADGGNARIIKADKDLNYLLSFTKPSDATFDQTQSFLPQKLVVDAASRVYCLVTNINKGIVKYEADGTFTGYIGANAVTVSMTEYIWKRFFMTKEQRSQTAAFVPTEYENIYIDDEGFIYATNTSFQEYDLLWDNAKPIRRINSLGNDILIKNDRYPPIGELYWVDGSQAYGPSKFSDITVMDNDIYVALDRFRGRLFGYDPQGVMLWAFGTQGNMDGAFAYAASIEHMGQDLFVLDMYENSITVFEPTEYGKLIYEAQEAYLNGDYDYSSERWNDVLKMNSNYTMAFRGLGRSVLRENKFEEAMEYFKLAHDRENYGRAFKLYRKEWVEKNIWWIVLILAVVVIVPLVLGRIKRTKWEVIAHEHSKVRK